MNDRTIQRVLGAAAACEPKDHRQAAIIGAIAESLIETGHFLPARVAATAADRMGWSLSVAANIDNSFRVIPVRHADGCIEHACDPLAPRIYPERGSVKMDEVREAAEVFRAQYDPPGEKVAA